MRLYWVRLTVVFEDENPDKPDGQSLVIAALSPERAIELMLTHWIDLMGRDRDATYDIGVYAFDPTIPESEGVLDHRVEILKASGEIEADDDDD